MALHRSGYSRKKAELEQARLEHALELQSINVELAYVRQNIKRLSEENAQLRRDIRATVSDNRRLVEAKNKLTDDLQALVTKRSPWIPRFSLKQLLVVFDPTPRRIWW
jgi:uncharacterized protein (DUF3084 family)